METKFPCPNCGQTDEIHKLTKVEAILHLADGISLTDEYAEGEWSAICDHAGSSEAQWDTQETIGIVCTHCGWLYEGDWTEYVKTHKDLENERIRQEFLQAIGLADENEVQDDG